MNLPTKRTLYVILIWLVGIAICFLIDYIRILHGGQINATCIIWNPVLDSDLQWYIVERKKRWKRHWEIVDMIPRDVEARTLFGQDGKTYSFRLRTVDFNGNISDPSNVIKEKFPRRGR